MGKVVVRTGAKMKRVPVAKAVLNEPRVLQTLYGAKPEAAVPAPAAKPKTVPITDRLYGPASQSTG